MTYILPVLSDDGSDAPHPGELSRRKFIGASGAAIVSCLLAQACGGGDGPTGPNGGVTPPPAGSLTFMNGVVTLKVGLIPALFAGNGHLVVSATDSDKRADVVV